jgi:DNA sulfur modification protein DndD
MKIRRLALSNIGAYHQEHVFQFEVNENQNIVLIGGKNGAGKTTIIEAIRIALYGPLAYGYKTESESYQKKIRSLLNKKALENGEGQFKISLEFDFVEGLQKHIFIFERQWNPIGNKVHESFSVYKDNVFILNLKEIDIIQTKIYHSFPPRLMELCLFDGETISRIISDDIISEYLKQSSYALYSIELFTNLMKDLEVYKKQFIGQFDSDLKQRYENISEEIDKCLKRKQQLTEHIKSLEQRKTEKEIEIDELKKQFKIYGGLIQEERENIIARINSLEQKRKTLSDKIKSFISGLFPFYIVREQIEAICRNMEAEEQYDIFNYLSKNITPNQIDDIFQKINVISKGNSPGTLFLHHLLDLIRPTINQPIHRASFIQRSQLQSVYSEINKLSQNEIMSWFNLNAKLLAEMQNLRKKLENNDTNNEFNLITERIQTFTTEIAELNALINQFISEIELLERRLAEKQKEKEIIERQISSVSKAATIIQNIEKIKSVSQEFIRIYIEEKMLQVQEQASWMFSQLIRKENFIERIQICPNSFEVSLFLPNGSIFDKDALSAGEKQILLLSLIWALIHVSNRKIPFVFDTLLGRLDANHKINVLSKLIPQCGEQVIILSTDSEIDSVHFDIIKPYVASMATLIHHTQTQSSNLESNRYFNLSHVEGFI